MFSKRTFILSFYLLASLVGVYLLHGLALTTKLSQKEGAADFDYDKCDKRHPERDPPGPSKDARLADTREGRLKQYLLPYVYMDEEFHIPQAATYFFITNYSHWDPMITTPFGAYLGSYFMLRPLYWLRSAAEHSTPNWAHDVNLDPRIEERLQLPEKIIRSVTRYIISWRWTPSEMVTLTRVSNCVVATIAVSILLSAFTKMTLKRVNDRFYVPLTRSDMYFDETTKRYVVSKETLEGVEKLNEARTHILSRCRRVIIPAVLQIGFYPTFFFFTALYYTEPMSILFLSCVFYCYSTMNRNSFLCWFSIAVWGFASVLVRQTNIVWVAYFAASHLIDVLFGYNNNNNVEDDKKHKVENSFGSRLFKIFFYTLPRQLPVILLGGAFVAWAIVLNEGSIVLGDKTSHQPTIHLAQLPIMLCFFCLFSPFQSLLGLVDFFKGMKNQLFSLKGKLEIPKRLTFVNGVIAILCGIFFTSAKSMQFHPYLIADNRHYTFYLYRYILRVKNLKIALCVAGGFVGVLFFLRDTFKGFLKVSSSSETPGITKTNNIKKEEESEKKSSENKNNILLRSIFQDVLFLVMSMIVVVPQKLIEPRYYLVPAMFQILRQTSNRLEFLTMNKTERRELCLFGEEREVVEEAVDVPSQAQAFDVGLNLIIHVLTMHIFLFWPFWAPDGSLGRFMW